MSADAWVLIQHAHGNTGLTVQDVEVHASEVSSGVLVRERVFEVKPRPGFPGVNDRTLVQSTLCFIQNSGIDDVVEIYSKE